MPQVSEREVLVEYTAHPEALFHFAEEIAAAPVPVACLEAAGQASCLQVVAPATQRVTIRTVDAESGLPTPARLHCHGPAGEYLPPLDRHRAPSTAYTADYGTDHVQDGVHGAAYILGETVVDLPLGAVYLEASKGFEMRPLRTTVTVTPATQEITLELERVLHWRERGWVSADTHVHLLSPMTALLQGAGEGVNVVNLLALQFGEFFTNLGDFDGASTLSSARFGSEHMVRVGSENRQHLLGHISLLGYRGNPILPLNSAGPIDDTFGSPLSVLLTEWAQQCRQQGGLVVLPHFPYPRAEYAAVLVSEAADATEMVGLDPYALVDWYRFLNCGYLTPCVGGTDKMGPYVAIGATRTYAFLGAEADFTYEAWMQAVRSARTFVTCGPLLDFAVEGQPMGARLALPASGGTVEVTWQAASAVVPMRRVELIVNGEVRESVAVPPEAAAGHWTVRLEQSAWLALLVRGGHPGQPEQIQAHSSPVMVEVDGSPFMAAADAVTILEQIEGTIAFLDTIATRADAVAYKRMRLLLTTAHRTLHNRLHQAGYYHQHTPVEDHAAHHA